MKTIGTATSNKGSFVVAAAATASGDVDAPPGWLPAKNLILQSVHNNSITIKHFLLLHCRAREFLDQRTMRILFCNNF